MHVTVNNIGREAQYFDGSSQKLTDTLGRTRSADTSAAIYLGDAQSFLNPGNSVQGTVVFDVPAAAAPEHRAPRLAVLGWRRGHARLSDGDREGAPATDSASR